MENLWLAFVQGLEDLVRRFGLGRIVGALSLVAGALMGLGIAVSEVVLLSAAMVYLMVVLLLTALALGLDRRRLYRQVADLSTILDRYGAELVTRQDASSFTIKEWDEQVDVNAKGDAHITRWFMLEVGPEPLVAFWHRCYKPTDDGSTGYQKHVRVSARAFDISNDGRKAGTRYPVTVDWTDQSLRTFVHFYESQQPGDIVLVRLSIRWPGFHRALIDGRCVEPFEWTFRRQTDNLAVKIRFSEAIGLRAPFHVQKIGSGPSPTQNQHSDGRMELEYEYSTPPQDQRLGFRLERV